MSRGYAARKLRSKTGAYSKIIEVAVPVRFFWDYTGFDGVEFGPFKAPVTRYQLRLIDEVLDEIMRLMGGHASEVSEVTRESSTDVPDVFLRAFKDRGDTASGKH